MSKRFKGLFGSRNLTNKTEEKSKDMRVRLAKDVYRVCLHHALSSQSEEVMGLLIGQAQRDENDQTVIEISALRIVPRLDKRPDRVEVSDDQMILATQVVEDLAKKEDKPGLSVIGWYHSHPKITVWPSHVDLRTQFSYQSLSKHFVGLIFSVFNVDKSKNSHHRYEVVAFQAREDTSTKDLKQMIIPVEVAQDNHHMSLHNAKEMVSLSDILCQENLQAAAKVKATNEGNALTSMKVDFGTYQHFFESHSFAGTKTYIKKVKKGRKNHTLLLNF